MANVAHAVVVEPDAIYREGLVHVMGSAGFVASASAATCDLLASLAVEIEPGLVVADFGQDLWNVGTHVAALRRRFPHAKVVVIADSGSERLLLNVLQSGADGLVLKPIGQDALIKSLELVMLGERIYPAHFIRLLATDMGNGQSEHGDSGHALEKLSARELDVLEELSSGSPNKVIARRFGITEATVKVHVKAILRKISARNRTEAAIWARNHMVGADQGERAVSAPAGSFLPAGNH